MFHSPTCSCPLIITSGLIQYYVNSQHGNTWIRHVSCWAEVSWHHHQGIHHHMKSTLRKSLLHEWWLLRTMTSSSCYQGTTDHKGSMIFKMWIICYTSIHVHVHVYKYTCTCTCTIHSKSTYSIVTSLGYHVWMVARDNDIIPLPRYYRITKRPGYSSSKCNNT